jgi:hypothetical protein
MGAIRTGCGTMFEMVMARASAIAGNAALDALVAETAVNLRFHHAMSSKTKLRTYASFMYQAGALSQTAMNSAHRG